MNGVELSEERVRDPWFNPGLWPATQRSNSVVGAVVMAMRQHGRKRALRSRDKDKLSSVLIPLVTNLMHHYLTGGHGQGIPVPRSKKGSRRKAQQVPAIRFPALVSKDVGQIEIAWVR